MISEFPFVVSEFTQTWGFNDHGEYVLTRLRLVYQSCPMGLRHAGRFAVALSYSSGTYVSVISVDRREKYSEWYFCGSLSNPTAEWDIHIDVVPEYPIRRPSFGAGQITEIQARTVSPTKRRELPGPAEEPQS